MMIDESDLREWRTFERERHDFGTIGRFSSTGAMCRTESNETVESVHVGRTDSDGSVEPVFEPVRLKGDYIIIDLLAIVTLAGVQLASLISILSDLQKHSCWVFKVRYKNQIFWIISSDTYDPEPAFEVSRGKTILGSHEHTSKFIAVVTKNLINLLLAENGEETGRTPEGGVSIEGIDGELICSGDGDFVISGSHSSERKVSRWIEDDCVRNADVLCAAGGRWTFCDESSSDDDDELTLEYGLTELSIRDRYGNRECIGRCPHPLARAIAPKTQWIDDTGQLVLMASSPWGSSTQSPLNMPNLTWMLTKHAID